MMLSFELRNNADWRQAFMLPTTDLTGAALRMRLGTLYLSTSNGRIVIDDPTVGAFSFVVPAADLNTVQPGHYRVDLLMFQPGKVKTVFTGKPGSSRPPRHRSIPTCDLEQEPGSRNLAISNRQNR
jgi:hypothetical protein